MNISGSEVGIYTVGGFSSVVLSSGQSYVRVERSYCTVGIGDQLGISFTLPINKLS